ncbi:MAG TPA: hypothetical protein VKA84_10030 [Gemmatimonadaceae bacterium]|nr:hypothetical protein [Gemmatimonadaceae bacterium]
MARKGEDNVELPGRGYNTDDVKTMKEDQKRGRGRRWGLLALLSILVVPALLFGLWSFITLSMSYSSGERVGYVQKFSRKGWVCKTWEGEMAMSTVPGSAPQYFQFSVRDDKVARQIEELMRTQEGRVSLTYEQKKGVPTSCFGETDYFVTEARAIGPAPGTTPPATTAPATPGAATPAPTTAAPPGAPPPRP